VTSVPFQPVLKKRDRGRGRKKKGKGEEDLPYAIAYYSSFTNRKGRRKRRGRRKGRYRSIYSALLKPS